MQLEAARAVDIATIQKFGRKMYPLNFPDDVRVEATLADPGLARNADERPEATRFKGKTGTLFFICGSLDKAQTVWQFAIAYLSKRIHSNRRRSPWVCTF